MPYIVDGNNLMHALRKAGEPVGRGGLCAILQMLTRRGEKVCVAFDGHERPGSPRPESPDALEILYSGLRKADDLIIERVRKNSAPRRLVVVSTDRQIRRAARRRRCQILTSEAFIRLLEKLTTPPEHRPRPEPMEKRVGLVDATDIRDWMEEFGIEPPDEDELPGMY